MASILSRRRLGTTIARVALDRIASIAHNRGRRAITILTYHRVLPQQSLVDYPFDSGVISATPEAFERQIYHIREQYNPITLSDVSAYLSGRCEIPQRAVVVTFDDGYRDNFIHAFPILCRLEVPATIFLATDYIGSGRVFWFDRAALLAMRGRAKVLELGDGSRVQVGSTSHDRRKAARSVLAWLKTLPQTALDQELCRLEEQAGNPLASEDRSLVEMMDWGDVREMVAAGVEFGSHSASHAILAHLNGDELTHELVSSKARMEAETRVPCRSIAYPVGRRFAFSDVVKSAAGRAGYQLALSYEPGANWVGSLEHFSLRRQSVEIDVDFDYFRSIVAMPEWFT